MKAVKRWRYYCDFCKRAAGTKPGMERHERGCTKNPDRVCGVCMQMQLVQQPMALLVAALPEIPDGLYGAEYIELAKTSAAALRSLAEGCPACMLAALRQSEASLPPEVFDYKKEMDAVWAEINDLRDEGRAY